MFEFASLTPEETPRWNAFCRHTDEAWFWHTTDWMDYSIAYAPDLQTRNLSFFVSKGSELLALCPLFVEERADSRRWLSLSGAAIPAPAVAHGLSRQKRLEVLRATFDRVSELAAEEEAVACAMRLSPLSAVDGFNILTKFGFLDTSLSTQILELDAPESSLLQGMRKGHRSAIKQAHPEVEIRIVTSEDVTQEAFNAYRELHRVAAGRVTRPGRTFELMLEWIRKGDAILCGARLGDRWIGFAYVNLFRKAAYYSSSCNDPTHGGLPISHKIQWEVIRWLKDNGFTRYELGLQHFGQQLHDLPTDKELAIASFKRGLGGLTVPLFQGERYWSREVLRETWRGRVDLLGKKL